MFAALCFALLAFISHSNSVKVTSVPRQVTHVTFVAR